MNKLYQKSELFFSLMWIAIYVVSMSGADYVSSKIGIEKCISLPVSVVLITIILIWMSKNNCFSKYGLCKSKVKSKKMLYYLPLILLVLVDFIYGINENIDLIEMVLFMTTMMMIGFIEEIVFRGFLFKAICKDSVNFAILISSITFGFGHLVNQINGSGMSFASNLLQIFSAIAVGFLFTLIFHKTKTLWPCIVAHGAANSFTILGNKALLTTNEESVMAICWISVAVIYSLYILKMKKEVDEELI